MNFKKSIIAVVCILVCVMMLCGCGKKAEDVQAPAATEAPAQGPGTAISPESVGIDPASLPEGVYMVEGPAGADGNPYATENSQAVSGNQTVAGNSVYIVDAPPEANAGGNSGVYIVDPPAGSGSSGVYIVDPPAGSGNSGVYVVDPPSGGGGGGKTIASGSFSSSTGTGLNITTSYTATTVDNSTVRVDVSARLSHSTLNAKSNSVSFSLGGQSRSVMAPAINWSGGSTSTSLGSTSFNVNLSSGQSTSLNLKTSWYFGGTYSGVSVSTVSSSGTVYLSR